MPNKIVLVIVPVAILFLGIGFFLRPFIHLPFTAAPAQPQEQTMTMQTVSSTPSTAATSVAVALPKIPPTATTTISQPAVITIPLNLKTTLSVAGTMTYGGSCYRNAEVQLRTIRFRPVKGYGDQTDKDSISFNVLFTNKDKQIPCYYRSELFRVIASDATIYLSDSGPVGAEVAPFSSVERTLYFTGTNETFRKIQLMIGSPQNPDAVYAIDFQTKEVVLQDIPKSQRTYLTIWLPPNQVDRVCVGDSLPITWESNGVDALNVYARSVKSPYDNFGNLAYFIGKFSATQNGTGIAGPGQGSTLWKVPQAQGLEDGETYNIVGWADYPLSIIVTSPQTFTYKICK